jgi:hypothetical protein
MSGSPVSCYRNWRNIRLSTSPVGAAEGCDIFIQVFYKQEQVQDKDKNIEAIGLN